jgi:hypothetical protein
MELYIQGEKKGKKTRNGEKFYEEFKDHFWTKPGKHYLS